MGSSNGHEEKVFGVEHPETLLSMGSLARTYSNLGKWNEAEQLAVQVMDMRKKLLGAEHPHTPLKHGKSSKDIQ